MSHAEIRSAPRAERTPARPAPSSQRPAIKVERLSKSFTIRGHHANGFKGRLAHPFRLRGAKQLNVLQEISFEVARGEFFGIVGRNGSGKSTLLKILASIYRADAGTIWTGPRIAPVIELGVGFQGDLAARENVLLNAEMIGLSPSVASERFDDVMRFADLEEYADLKLKNYSAGMRVRLAFAIATHTDADIFLFDEVLAVGDVAFQRRCEERFAALKNDPDKTVILVTHQLPRMTRICDRALLLEKGRIERIGDPEAVARRYAEVQLEGDRSVATKTKPTPSRRGVTRASMRGVWIGGPGRERIDHVERGQRIRLHAVFEATSAIARAGLRIEVRNSKGGRIFVPPLIDLGDAGRGLEPGDRLHVVTTIENKLVPGRYFVACAAHQLDLDDRARISRARTTEFTVVSEETAVMGLVELDHEVEVTMTSAREHLHDAG